MKYSVNEIVGKNLRTLKDVNVYVLPNKNTDAAFVIEKDQFTPIVDSYIQNESGLWWVVSYDEKQYYILHQIGSFDADFVEGQFEVKKPSIWQRIEDNTIGKIESISSLPSATKKTINFLIIIGLLIAVSYFARTVYKFLKK